MSDQRNGRRNEHHSWIVAAWSDIFLVLAQFSIFELLRAIFKRARRSYAFVEYYVTVNTVLALVSLWIASDRSWADVTPLLVVAAVYGSVRIWEIFVYQVNVLIFDEYRTRVDRKMARDFGLPPATWPQRYAVRGYRRIVLLLLHNYFEIVCWFGLIYVFFLPERGDWAGHRRS